MKQTITKEQWEEVCKDGDKLDVNIIFNPKQSFSISYNDMTIGGIIEFLGDDLSIWDDSGKEFWYIAIYEDGIKKVFEAKELVDALWEAVKYKLK